LVLILSLYSGLASKYGNVYQRDILKGTFFALRYGSEPNAFELDPYGRKPNKLIQHFHECIKGKKPKSSRTQPTKIVPSHLAKWAMASYNRGSGQNQAVSER
jgi:hypothetical protein